MKNIHKILFPGWGVAKEEYAGLNPETVIDYGFFKEEKSLDLMEPASWLLEIQPTEPYILIGHSMGSLFVLRNSQLRDNAQAIIIIGGFAKFAESDNNPYGKSALEVNIMQRQLRRNPRLLMKSFYRTMFYPAHQKVKISETLNISQLHHGLELLKICDIRKDLENIKVPVMIMNGKKDAIVSAKLAETLNDKIVGSSLMLFHEGGHALPITNADEIADMVEEMIKYEGL